MAKASTQGERLARLETEMGIVRSDTTEMKDDIKTLLGAHNQQKGKAKLLHALTAALAAMGGSYFEHWRHS